MKNNLITQRFNALYSERQSSIDGIWDDIETYVMPLRGEMYTDTSSENQVQWERGDRYDSTAVTACQSLAASMQANITSFSQKWFDLKFSDDELNSDSEAMEWLEEVGAMIYDALIESNFDVEISEAYLDLVSFGTSVLFEEEDNGDLLFTAIPLRDCVFEENSRKQVSHLYRRLWMTPLQMIDKFGEEGVPDKTLKLKDTPTAGTAKEEVIFCVFPRKTNPDLDMTKPIAAKARPFGYKYICKESSELLGEEGGYYEMPAYVTRWAKTGGSKWGYSPAMTCIDDIKTLNLIKDATLTAAGKAIDPPTLAEDGTIIGDLDLDRGGLTIVTNIDGLRPYESATKFDVSNMNIQMLIDSIRKTFFQDQLELKESPAMTATEVNVRYELMQRLLGPVVARLKTDLLDPFIQRSFNILYRQGVLPEMPEGLNADLNIEYSGVLPRSQKSNVVQQINAYLGSIAGLAEVFPQMLEIVNVDEMARELALLGGVPSKALHSKQEIQEKREAAQKQAQKQQQIAEAQQMGQAAESVGKGMQSIGGAGDMMEGMGEMMGGEGGMPQ